MTNIERHYATVPERFRAQWLLAHLPKADGADLAWLVERYREADPAACAAYLAEHPLPPDDPEAPDVPRYSKLRLVVALKQMGLWERVKEWIVANDLYDEYLAAQNVAADNEYFQRGLAALKSQLGVSDETSDALLASCLL